MPKSLQVLLAVVFAAVLLAAAPARAQTRRGALQGRVVDSSGGAVLKFSVKVTGSGGRTLTPGSGGEGTFELKDLPAGTYTVQVIAAGFAPYREQVTIAPGMPLQLDVTLPLARQQAAVTVTAEGAATLDVTPVNNASAVVLVGRALAALPDDPEALAADLAALAGPTAGPEGGQMYIDGFTAGELPPKSSIPEIRINQNPFSAEYERVGQGRIEIFTKPGTEKWHGQVSLNANAPALDSKNPFSIAPPDFETTQWDGEVGGALSKKASFYFSGQYRQTNFPSVVSAFSLSGGEPAAFNQVVNNPWTLTVLRPQLAYQLSKSNTLTARYQLFRIRDTHNGIGGLVTEMAGFDSERVQQSVQIADTQVFGEKLVHEIRFQFLTTRNEQMPLSSQPGISVLGSLIAGGNTAGNLRDRTSSYEVLDRVSFARGRHFLKFGVRVRAVRDTNHSEAGFNGLFVFPSLDAYAAGQPSQFSFTVGSPAANVFMADAGLYVEDDWRVRPNVTLSSGLRFETQNGIHDRGDWAPRVGIAWGIGGTQGPKTVLRGGAGIFYSRFPANLMLQAGRLNPNAPAERQFLISEPGFFCPNSLADCPPLATLEAESSSIPTFFRIGPNLRTPYIVQESASLERQLSKKANVSISYVLSQGFAQLLTNNVNAPLPGTFTIPNPDQMGTRPNGIAENIYEFQSRGRFRQRQLVANFNFRGSKVSFNGNYTLNYANANTSGATNFPSDPYNLAADYGRAAFDVRHRLFAEGSATLPKGFVLSPFLAASSGTPYNITLGQDLIGSSLFNQRPAFATALSNPANVVVTRFGAFDTVPVAGEKLVPVNFLTGPAQFTMNLRLSKTFGFGRAAEAPGDAGGGAAKRYSLTLSATARNVFNIVNLARPIGNLSSPLFGQSNTLSGGLYSGLGVNRQIFLQMSFGF